MEFLMVVLIIVLLVRYVVIRERLKELDLRITASATEADSWRNEQVSRLTQRVWRLEQALQTAPPEEVPEVAVKPAPALTPESVASMEPAVAPAEAEPPAPAVRRELAAILQAQEEAPPSDWSRRLRRAFGGEEWESLVGGSLLNKIGALVLVIGIALFLSYSFARMTPAGRSSIALAISGVLLASGVRVERKHTYRIFARGLIGAGWAGLYATTYAMYTLPAARIIDNPVAGSVLLLLVAAGMIGHSLAYRLQAITGIAYFAAFAALAATPSTPFAVVSLIPLAASILYLAYRFDWHTMAVFGLLATYGTCIWRGESNASLESTQTLFLAYWALFEAFDWTRIRRRITSGGVPWIFPLNAAGFLGLSYLAWSYRAPNDLWMMAALGSALYLASATVRVVLRPPSSFAEGAELGARLSEGGYEASFTLSAVLAGLAIVARVPGIWISVWIGVEAELLYLAGVRFRVAFLRWLGGAGFTFSLGRIFLEDVLLPAQTAVLGHPVYNWSPPLLLHAFLFYLNRALWRPNPGYSFLASALVAIVLGAEMPERFVGAAWLAYAAVLLEIGLRGRLKEFRLQASILGAIGAGTGAMLGLQITNRPWISLAVGLALLYAATLRVKFLPAEAMEPSERRWLAWGSAAGTAALSLVLLWRTIPHEYAGLSWCVLAVLFFELGVRRLPGELRFFSYVAGAMGAGAVVILHLDDLAKFAAMPVWLSYAGAAITAWTITGRMLIGPRESIPGEEQIAVRDLFPAFGSAFAMVALWVVLPDAPVVLSWAAVAIAWIELGRQLRLGSFRLLGNAMGAVVFARACLMNLPDTGVLHGVSHRLLTVVPVIASHVYVWYRLERAKPQGAVVPWGRLHLWAAAILAAALLFFEYDPMLVVVGWAGLDLALLFLGTRFALKDLRWQSYMLAILTFVHCSFNNLLVIPDWLWTVPAVVASFFAAQMVAATGEHERAARPFFSVLATALLAAFLYQEVSGSLLTVVWGLEGLALLGAGFPLRERVLRLEGLVVLLVCILKLFVYDLRNLETMYRILSFVALGLILLGVSWIYTRFRARIRRYL